MIDTRDKTTTLYAYQNGIGANTEAILTRTLRHILYGNLYGNGGNGGGRNGHLIGRVFTQVDHAGIEDQVLAFNAQ